GARSLKGCALALLVGERLDHLLGDVDFLAGENDGILQYQVEFLRFRNLLDHPVRALLDARQLLVAAKVQILAELALLPRQVALEVREVALLVATVALRHRDTFPSERGLQIAPLLAQLLDIGVARGEFLFELQLRALRRRRFTKQPLGVDEADLVVGRLRMAGPDGEERGQPE